MRAEGDADETEMGNVTKAVLQLFHLKAPKTEVNLKDSDNTQGV
jgi:hypothetical protein